MNMGFYPNIENIDMRMSSIALALGLLRVSKIQIRAKHNQIATTERYEQTMNRYFINCPSNEMPLLSFSLVFSFINHSPGGA